MLGKIKEIINQWKEYIESEIEVIQLKALNKIGDFMGLVFSAIFIIVLFHITMALVGIWLGFLFSSVFDNMAYGFGLTVIIYAIWFALSLIFRKQLLVRPFKRFLIHAILDQEEEDDLPMVEDVKKKQE